MFLNVSVGDEKEMSTTAEQCVKGPHVTLNIHDPYLDPPACSLWTNLTCVSVYNFVLFLYLFCS